jgi:hypothetical protein
MHKKIINQEYEQMNQIIQDLNKLENICIDLNLTSVLETATDIYIDLKTKNANFLKVYYWPYSIINYSLILNNQPQKIKKLAECAKTGCGKIAKSREDYKKILLNKHF